MEPQTLTDTDIEVRLLLEAIYLKYNYDFRDYSNASIQRRLDNAQSRFGLRSITEIQEKVLHDPDFFLELLQYLTVSTSDMFRDPSYFLAIRQKVVPVLKTYPSLKIWIAGCSTGEEVYSFAILLQEEGLLDRTLLYATDINPLSLKRASEGIFKQDRIRDYTSNYQKAGGRGSFADYYTASYESALLEPSLRRNIVFADHSLSTDSVFSEMHLVSCRNVLIYFTRHLQDRAVGLFYESLCYKGFLGLGSKESLRFTSYDKRFDAFDPANKIYQKK